MMSIQFLPSPEREEKGNFDRNSWLTNMKMIIFNQLWYLLICFMIHFL